MEQGVWGYRLRPKLHFFCHLLKKTQDQLLRGCEYVRPVQHSYVNPMKISLVEPAVYPEEWLHGQHAAAQRRDISRRCGRF